MDLTTLLPRNSVLLLIDLQKAVDHPELGPPQQPHGGSQRGQVVDGVA
jgi:hypothetical protein